MLEDNNRSHTWQVFWLYKAQANFLFLYKVNTAAVPLCILCRHQTPHTFKPPLCSREKLTHRNANWNANLLRKWHRLCWRWELICICVCANVKFVWLCSKNLVIRMKSIDSILYTTQRDIWQIRLCQQRISDEINTQTTDCNIIERTVTLLSQQPHRIIDVL